MSRFLRFGPVARHVLDSIGTASSSSAHELIKSALSDSLRLLPRVLEGAADLDYASVAHSVFLVLPQRIEGENEELRGRDFAWRSRVNVDFLSPPMREEATAFFEVDRVRETDRLHALTLGLPQASALSEWLLEQTVHTIFTTSFDTLQKAGFDVSMLSPLNLSGPAKRAFINNCGLTSFTLSTPRPDEGEAIYFQPHSFVFPLIDSALWTGTALMLIQVTASKRHSFDLARLALILERFAVQGVSAPDLHFVVIGRDRSSVGSVANSFLRARDLGVSSDQFATPQLPRSRKRRLSGTSVETDAPQTHLGREVWQKHKLGIARMPIHAFLWDGRSMKCTRMGTAPEFAAETAV